MIVDFESGPKVNQLWLPSRTITDLYASESSFTKPFLPGLYVDNYWHHYHIPIGVHNWTGPDVGLLGELGPDIPPQERAPPLPTCLPLTADQQFSHPIQDAVASFQPYELSSVLINGGDDDHLQAVRRGDAPAAEGPFPRVPALLWHRVAFEDFVHGRPLLHCPNTSALCRARYVSLTEQGRAAFCANKGFYAPDLEPEMTCDGGRREPPVAYPYCSKARAHTHTYARTRTRTRTHARTRTHTHVRTHAQTHVYTCTHARTHACTRTHTCTHPHHTHVNVSASTHTHTRTHREPPVHTYTRAHTHAARARTHAHTTHENARARTHKHTRTQRAPVAHPGCSKALRLDTRTHTRTHAHTNKHTS